MTAVGIQLYLGEYWLQVSPQNASISISSLYSCAICAVGMQLPHLL